MELLRKRGVGGVFPQGLSRLPADPGSVGPHGETMWFVWVGSDHAALTAWSLERLAEIKATPSSMHVPAVLLNLVWYFVSAVKEWINPFVLMLK